MKAIELKETGGPDVLQLAERPDPVAEPGRAVVRVRAANVNPTDLAARSGHAPRGLPDLPFVLGWDFAGEVLALGEGVGELNVGDRVVGMIQWYDNDGRLGAYAEQVSVDPSWFVPLPASLEFAEAATIPLNAVTAVQGLELLALDEPTTLLVTGASGAVGSFAVQLAVREGHRVMAIASQGDEEWVRGLGAHEVLPRDTDLASVGPLPAVFDAVPLGEAVYAAVEDGGATVHTRRVPPPEPDRGIRQEVFLIHSDQDQLRDVVNAAGEGRLKTRVARVLPLARAAEAHRLVEAGGLRGKVVLEP